MKRFVSSIILSTLFSLTAHAEPQNCPGVHVWYSLANESQSKWAVQVARIYENNISFVDENCSDLNLDNKLELSPSETRYVGMKVNAEKGFYATYSFMGVNLGSNGRGALQIPKGVASCAFFVAPYAPGQMDRVDWKTNNADCYANNYGTEMHFK